MRIRLTTRGRRQATPSTLRARFGELEHQLQRSRRREEPADLLVARGESLAPVAGVLRATDAWELDRAGAELRVLLDGPCGDRAALERRLGAATAVGWARSPDDGAGLDALLAHARAAAGRPGRRTARAPRGARGLRPAAEAE